MLLECRCDGTRRCHLSLGERRERTGGKERFGRADRWDEMVCHQARGVKGVSDERLPLIFGRYLALDVHKHYVVVFTPDLGRAVETMSFAFAGADIPIIQDARLRECNDGFFSENSG